MKIYLTWDHGEDGPENLMATVNKAHIFEMVEKSGYLEDKILSAAGCKKEDIKKKVDQIIENNECGVFSLFGGWGGLHIQIAESHD